ncbi:MAG: BtpA/SgcQ family protein [Phycisphaerales bacterium]
MTTAERTSSLFGRHRAIVGMLHVSALPGTPHARDPVASIVRRSVDEASLLAEVGFDALLIENMHDAPYLQRDVGPEIVAAMTAVACGVRAAVRVPVGVQILAGANRAALAVALAADLGFIRAEGFVFASVADEGLLAEADAGSLLRYRRAIGAERVAVLADIKKKHSAHAITSDVGITDMASGAEFFGADAIVVTGTATGSATEQADIDAARRGSSLPIVVGSGATAATIEDLLRRADAVIVGSDLKENGRWSNRIDRDRARAFVEAARSGS